MKEGWTIGKFSDFFDLQMGKTPSRDNPSYWGGANIWVSIADMNCGKYLYDTKEYITDSAVSESGIHRVKKDTVIMSFKLSIGKTAIATKDLYTNEAIMSFNTKEGYQLVPDFIYYYLKGYKWQGMNKAVMGMTLNKKAISNNYFSFPSILEQQHIVEELDMLSSIMEKKNAQVNELDNLAQSLFFDMFGDPITNEKRWETRKLEDVCDVRDGTHDSPKYVTESDYVLITSKNIQDGDINFKNANYITKEDYDKINVRSCVDNGDIIMAMIGTIGKPIIVNKGGRKFGIKNVALLKFHKSHDVINTFIKAVLDNATYMNYIHSLNRGGTQKFVSLKTIRSLPIFLPPLDLQNQFASKIEAIEHQKVLLKKSIKEVETLLNSRMDYWFN